MLINLIIKDYWKEKKDENDLDYLEIDPSRVLAAITIQKAYKAYKSKQ